MGPTFTISAVDEDFRWKVKMLATESRRSSSQYIRYLIDEEWKKKQKEKETSAQSANVR